MKDFFHTWGDKFILLGLIVFFALLARHGWHIKEADMASFASDLAKQLVSSLLTLLVAAKVLTPKPPDGNGATK